MSDSPAFSAWVARVGIMHTRVLKVQQQVLIKLLRESAGDPVRQAELKELLRQIDAVLAEMELLAPGPHVDAESQPEEKPEGKSSRESEHET